MVEEILAVGPGSATSRCLDGSRACPPEDVGGWSGYADFLEAKADPRHPDHDDLNGANQALKMSASGRFR